MRYTAEEIAERRKAGIAGAIDHLPYEEAMRRRAEDPDAPEHYPGWEKTIVGWDGEGTYTFTLDLEAEVFEWFQRHSGQHFPHELLREALREYAKRHALDTAAE